MFVSSSKKRQQTNLPVGRMYDADAGRTRWPRVASEGEGEGEVSPSRSEPSHLRGVAFRNARASGATD